MNAQMAPCHPISRGDEALGALGLIAGVTRIAWLIPLAAGGSDDVAGARHEFTVRGEIGSGDPTGLLDTDMWTTCVGGQAFTAKETLTTLRRKALLERPNPAKAGGASGLGWPYYDALLIVMDKCAAPGSAHHERGLRVVPNCWDLDIMVHDRRRSHDGHAGRRSGRRGAL